MSDKIGYLRGKAAAEYLCISGRTLRSWAEKRLIPCYKPTKRCTLYKISDLDAMIAESVQEER